MRHRRKKRRWRRRGDRDEGGRGGGWTSSGACQEDERKKRKKQSQPKQVERWYFPTRWKETTETVYQALFFSSSIIHSLLVCLTQADKLPFFIPLSSASPRIQQTLSSRDFLSRFTEFYGCTLTIDGKRQRENVQARVESERVSERASERVRDRDRANEERDGFHFAFHLCSELVH